MGGEPLVDVHVHIYPDAEAGVPAREASAVAAEAMLASNRWIASVVRDSPVAEALISVDPTVLSAQAITAHLGTSHRGPGGGAARAEFR